jgi:hypothetical protein
MAPNTDRLSPVSAEKKRAREKARIFVVLAVAGAGFTDVSGENDEHEAIE